MKKERLLITLLILFGAALGVRWIAMGQNQFIARDAILYIKSAKLYATGDYAGGFNAFPRSIFPLFIVFTQRIFGDWVRGGQWVSTFFGALIVIPFYFLARRIFGEKVALISAIFYIVCPSLVKDSAEVLREMPFLFFYTTALWLGYEGIKRKRPEVMGLACFFILFSASLKDYGLLLFVPLILFLCWYVIKRQITLGKAILLCSAFLAVAIIILFIFGSVSYYKGFDIRTSIFTRAESGFIGSTHQGSTISGLKKEMEKLEFSQRGKRLFGLAVDNGFAIYLSHFLRRMVYAFNIILFLLFLLGLIKRRIVPYHLDEFLLITLYAVYFPVVFLYLSYTFFLQTKSIYPLLVPSLIWSGVGLEELRERIVPWLQRYLIRRRSWDMQRVGLLLLILIVVVMLSKAWTSPRQDKFGEKELGTWLRNHGYGQSIIVGQEDFDRLAFYAESEFIPFPKGSYEEILRFAREKKASLLVVDWRTIDLLSPGFSERLSPKDLQPVPITGIMNTKYGTIIFNIVGQGQ